jgi:ABC-2 type transport system ATP-binding protein
VTATRTSTTRTPTDADAGRIVVSGLTKTFGTIAAVAGLRFTVEPGTVTGFLGDPRVLVLDEPGNGLDPEGIAWMRKLLRQLADEGRTVLVSSHLLAEVQQLVDHVVIINRGRLVHDGPLAGIAGLASPTVSIRTPQAGQLAAALAASAIGPRPEVDRTGPDSLRVVGAEPAMIGRIALAERIELHELAAEHGGLEQYFLELTAKPVVSAPAADEVA